MDSFRERLESIRERMRLAADACGRDSASISLLAVSKFHPPEALLEAVECGVTHFGENYVQEAASKALALPSCATFALTGPLQRNKAKQALQHFHEIMTIDRLELATRLVRLAEELGLTREAWIQVDLWGETSKMGGCPPESVSPILGAMGRSNRLPIKGFMAIPPIGMASAFADLAAFREDWQQRLGREMLLSMGMSDDLEEAIKAGSDQVRIGTALFGERH